jgi:hypothetical protein
MKKYSLSFFLVLLLSAFTVSISVNAQTPEPPCSYSCAPPFTPWTYVLISNQALPNGSCPTCLITFEYWYRECNGEIQVVLGSVYQTGNCTQCESWIPWYAADWVAKNNPLILGKLAAGWRPETRYCYNDYKLSMVTCYHWVAGGGGIVTNPGGWHTEPCLTTECCVFKLEICKNEDGVIESAYQLQSSPVICEDGCFNGCGFYSDYYEKNAINTTSEFENVLNPIFISPNPNNGNFRIDFNNSSKGNYSIIIFDILGNTIFSENISVKSIDYQQEISLDKCKAGTYIYNIMLDNEIYQSGKLNIFK